MIGPEHSSAAPAAVATKVPVVAKAIELQDDTTSQSSDSPTELSRRNSFSSLKSIDSRTSFLGLALPDVCAEMSCIVTRSAA
jgi:hypothetical protein